MPTFDRLSKLIGKIYAVARNAETWHEVLGDVASLTSARVTSLLSFRPNSTQDDKVLACFGADPVFVALYEGYYQRCNIYAHTMRPLSREGLVIPHERVCSDQTILNSEYYNDFSRHIEVYRVIAGTVESRPGRRMILTANRGRQDGAFRSSEIQLIEMLIPHVRESLAISRYVEMARSMSGEVAACKPIRPDLVAPESLAFQFGLTKAEALFAYLLMSGLSTAQICERLNIRLTTARTHLKHLYQKTGVRKQCELVSKLFLQSDRDGQPGGISGASLSP